ncbi:MAG: NmrA family NAD(P)-binding protein [Anaerolineales bacterium]|nr:NmrA family NAD(P)-binding protein [Anaerolineales bacterium]
MIAVMGAAGKTGRAVTRALAARGATVRALVRRPEQQATALAEGAREVVVGDLRDPQALAAALAGARAVYHLCPNMHPDEGPIGQAVSAAALAAGVPHFVYHSVLHPQTEDMPHHWRKLRVEELLFKTGLSVTILQPTAYMQNLLAGWAAISGEGLHRSPYAAASRISLVDLRDVAEAAALVLSEPGHAGATYELAGTPGLSQTQVAETLSEALGRPVRAETVDRAAWSANAEKNGLGAEARATLLQMFEYYERYGLCGSPRALTALLGRAPTTLAAFARDAAAANGKL